MFVLANFASCQSQQIRSLSRLQPINLSDSKPIAANQLSDSKPMVANQSIRFQAITAQ
ncbi:MAG: hypothetical protein R3Y07_09875 [Eubacteriales bacterium]